MEDKDLIVRAREGDINAFQQLFNTFSKKLKAYIYRLVTDRNHCEDLLHDVYLKSFEKLSQFEGKSSLKSWMFSISTNMCIDFLKDRKRWESDSQDRSRIYTESNFEIIELLMKKNQYIDSGVYEIKEHIDFCFTCMSKTLPIEQQICLILKDMLDFKVNEISKITSFSVPVIKHHLHDSRKTMTDIFDNRCALVNKNGACHQCSELNEVFNPKQNAQQEIIKLGISKNLKKKEELLELRTKLIKHIDPLNTEGSDLHEVFMQLTRKVEGEIEKINIG